MDTCSGTLSHLTYILHLHVHVPHLQLIQKRPAIFVIIPISLKTTVNEKKLELPSTSLNPDPVFNTRCPYLAHLLNLHPPLLPSTPSTKFNGHFTTTCTVNGWEENTCTRNIGWRSTVKHGIYRWGNSNSNYYILNINTFILYKPNKPSFPLLRTSITFKMQN